MGTRNLTMVIENAEPKVAQYGQWDGYPSGQGITILDFLNSTNIEEFTKKLQSVKFIDKDKNEEIDEYLKSIGSTDGWMTSDQSALYKAKYPYLSRDHGGDILRLIMESTDDIIWINDSRDFVNDSLFCEWCYVIDLDKKTFEIYEGFIQSPISETERFYSKEPNKGGYYPVKLVKSFSLESLPTETEFLDSFKEEEEETD